MNPNRRKLVAALVIVAVAVVSACWRTGSGPSVLDVTTYSNALEDCRDQSDARAADDQCRATQRAAWCARFPTQHNCDGGLEQ